MDTSRQAVMFEASATGLLLILAILFFAPSPSVHSDPPTQSSPPSVQTNPQEAVRQMIANELKQEKSDKTHWRFRKLDVKPGRSETWDVVETKNGEVQRLLEVNGHPLTTQQQRAEQERMRRFLASHTAETKKRKSAADDSDKEQKLLAMLPNALLYQYDGKQGDLVKLKFKPNPRFHASTHEAEVFHHMTGELIYNDKNMRLAELRGQLASRVNFGYGLLGHLNKGGTFDVRQGTVAADHWDMTLLDTEITGKALFFKTISVREKLVESDYHRVSDDLTVKQGAELLSRDDARSAARASKKAS